MCEVRPYAADSYADRLGVTYAASSLLSAGQSRAEVEYVGRRSGELGSGRALGKLGNASTAGHTHQVLRAVWEGGRGTATARRADGTIAETLDLTPIRAMVPATLTPLARQYALRRAWKAMREAAERVHGAVRWTLEADTTGYERRVTPPKYRYIGYLGAPYYVAQLARRSRYLRASVLAAEQAWYSTDRRWPRGLGYNWPKRPHRLGAPPMPTA